MNIDALMNSCFAWEKTNTIINTMPDGRFEIITPLIDRHNDCLAIYARIDGDEIELDDDGCIASDLEMCGLDLKSEKRKALIARTLCGYNVEFTDGVLKTQANAHNFPARKYALLQAMLAMDGLYCLMSPSSPNLFVDDVARWFDDNNVRYSPSVIFAGKSGYSHKFDFVIPKSKAMPERVIDVIGTPSKQNIESTLFKWTDTKDTREDGCRLYALLNDKSIKRPDMLAAPLRNYGVTPVFWSNVRLELKQFAG